VSLPIVEALPIRESVRKRFDPDQPRDPHTGRWVDLLKQGYEVRRVLEGGFNKDKPQLVRLSDGTEVVLKKTPTAEETDAEVLGSHLAEALGIKGLKVERIGPTEFVSNFVAGESGGKRTGRGRWAGLEGGSKTTVDPALLQAKNAKLIAVLDWLIDNSDRHGENWIIQDDGSIVPIDHGKGNYHRTRGETGGGKKGPWEIVPANDFVVYHLGVRTNKYGELTGLKPDLTDDDLSGARSALEKMKKEYEDAGRTAWYQEALARLEMLERAARRRRR